MLPHITDYINDAPAEQKQIMETVRQLVHESVPNVQEEFKWGRPIFRSAHDFAYLKTTKAYVTLGFFKYEKLDDKDNLLEGTGKDMRHIKLKKAADIDQNLLKKWFKMAAE